MKLQALFKLCLLYGLFGSMPTDLSAQAILEGCQAQAVQPQITKTEKITYPVYVGSDLSAPYVKTVYLELIAGRKTDIHIVTDTTATKYYVLQNFTITQQIRKGGQMVWVDVICNGFASKPLVTLLQKRLKEKNLYKGEITGIFTPQTKKALVNYQRNKGIPFGQLDIKTLEYLGIETASLTGN